MCNRAKVDDFAFIPRRFHVAVQEMQEKLISDGFVYQSPRRIYAVMLQVWEDQREKQAEAKPEDKRQEARNDPGFQRFLAVIKSKPKIYGGKLPRRDVYLRPVDALEPIAKAHEEKMRRRATEKSRSK